MTTVLQELLDELRRLRHRIKQNQAERVSRRELKEAASEAATLWLSKIAPDLGSTIVSDDVRAAYAEHFGHLIELAGGNSRTTAYLRTLDAAIKNFRRDLILPLQKAPTPRASPSAALLAEVLKGLPDPAEDEYLSEAVACARQGFFRAAAVLGWCAAVDRIHRTIERVGFVNFNVTSARMASEAKGRFKRFNAPQNVSSLSDLRAVFDTNLLWILEGMGLIDLNQHTRLRSCFELRTQCAHPGDAPVTEFNLMSYFSDLNEVVLRNGRFAKE